MLALREACIGPLTPLARPALAGNRMAQRWLHRSGTPYADEVDAIATIAGADGVHLLNTSYEWGCTALAAPAPAGDSARLLRTLDWYYPGLGRRVEVVRQTGVAGDFWNITWPGAVGVLTAIAPGRFAAAINQAPLERRIAAFDTPTIDSALNVWDVWHGDGRTPALHLLRRVFETAQDFATARAVLEQTPIANPTIYSLVGLSPEETCIIERTRTGHFTRAGVASAANIWRYGEFPGRWRDIGENSDDERRDSRERSEMIERFAGKDTGDFAWVEPPILISTALRGSPLRLIRGGRRCACVDTSKPARMPPCPLRPFSISRWTDPAKKRKFFGCRQGTVSRYLCHHGSVIARGPPGTAL